MFGKKARRHTTQRQARKTQRPHQLPGAAACVFRLIVFVLGRLLPETRDPCAAYDAT